MTTTANCWLVLLLSALLAGCGSAWDGLFCDDASCTFSTEEWARLQSLSPMPAVPDDSSNGFRANPLAAELGARFYSDPRFSGPATQVDAIGRESPLARAPRGQATGVSCATCHDLAHAGIDVTSVPNNVSAGAGWTDVNSPSTVNSAFAHLWFWNGRADSSWALAVAVAESPTTMNGNRLKTAWIIADHYRKEYDAVFAGAGFPLPLLGGTADAAALLDEATGLCRLVNGTCPAGCRLIAGSPAECHRAFPPQGKPGTVRDCQRGDPVEPFGDAWDCMTPVDQIAIKRILVNWAKALDAYQATLLTGETPFDRFVAEGPGSNAISPAARRGAQLFVGKAGCVDCHTGPLFSDGAFHNIGTPQSGPLVPGLADCTAGRPCLPWGAWDGLEKLRKSEFVRGSIWSDDAADVSRAGDLKREPTESLKGAWRTPGLRNVGLTAPYMHDGVYTTLAEVVAHYAAGGAAQAQVGIPAVQLRPLHLSTVEQADLVAFLDSLTGPILELPPTQGTGP